MPVPFTGELVSSKNGSYRVRQKDTSKGNYVLERIDVDGEWKVCHAFYKHIIDETVVNDVLRRVIEDEKSIFNKGPIAVKLTNFGHVSLTNTSLTEIIYGEKRSVKLQKINIKSFYILYLLLSCEYKNSRFLFRIGYFYYFWFKWFSSNMFRKLRYS